MQIVKSGTVTVLGHPAGSRRAAPSRRVRHAERRRVRATSASGENLRYFASVLGAPRGDADRVIEEVGLGNARDQLATGLSGGQLHRASLAVALLGEPELLVLDEPTVGLDPVLRGELWELFHELAAGGTTLLVSSHVMDEAARCERLLLMRDGELLADDTPDALRERTGAQDLEEAFLRLIQGQEVRGMNLSITLATTRRILAQLRHDRRTLGLLIGVPSLLMILLRYVMDRPQAFDRYRADPAGRVPVHRDVHRHERRHAARAHQRHPRTPDDHAARQARPAARVRPGVRADRAGPGRGRRRDRPTWLGLDLQGPTWALFVVTLLDALLGMALGLFASAFARTEFQAVQFMPAFVLPQILLAGCSSRAGRCRRCCGGSSDVMPLSYAVAGHAGADRRTAP